MNVFLSRSLFFHSFPAFLLYEPRLGADSRTRLSDGLQASQVMGSYGTKLPVL